MIFEFIPIIQHISIRMVQISHKIVQYGVEYVTLVGELKLHSVQENYRDLDKQPLSEAFKVHISKAISNSPVGWITSRSRYILIEQSVQKKSIQHLQESSYISYRFQVIDIAFNQNCF